MRCYRSTLAAACVLLLAAGCGRGTPKPSPDELPAALIALETQTEAIFAAFDAGDPKAADRPLHRLGVPFSKIEQLAAPAGLTADQQAALGRATADLLDAFGDLHAPMHQAVFPDDFEFEPIRERLVEGLKDVRAALPVGLVAKLQMAKEARDARRSPSPATPPSPPEPAGAVSPPDGPPLDDAFDGLAPEPDIPADPALDPPGTAGPSVDDGAAIAPLCPSVMLWDDASYELAPERVSRAAVLMAGAPPDRSWVQLVPTLHARLNADLTINAFGAMHDRGASWTDADNFQPATDALADRFRDAFAAAIRQAVRRGMHVAILPHLDPAGGPVSEWRNLYDFAPGETIGAGSYESLLIEPLAVAIEAEATPDTRIDLALSGEMGRSLFQHPGDYLALLQRLRDRFAQRPRTTGVRIGVALNWSGLAGEAPPDTIATADAAALLEACDFVGISCYAPVSLPPVATDFASATDNFLRELRTLADVPGLTPELIYAEAGIGGGGESPEDIAARPYEGRGDAAPGVWRADDRARLRADYHAALCDYLAGATRPTVRRAFLWSEGPWDPQGVADRRFYAPAIAQAIDAHNRR